jgi:hypothetical protein
LRSGLLIPVLLMLALPAGAADPQPVHPFESSTAFEPVNPIDEHVLAALQSQGHSPPISAPTTSSSAGSISTPSARYPRPRRSARSAMMHVRANAHD